MNILKIIIALLLTNACTKQAVPKQEPIPDVALRTAALESVTRTIEWGGYARAQKERVIPADVEGSLTGINVKVGARVVAGEPLYHISPKGSGLEYKMNSGYAPFAGIVSAIHKERGAVVHSGEPIVTVSDPSQMEVEVQIAPQDIGSVHSNDQVKILPSVVLGNDKTKQELNGKFVAVSQVIDQSLGTFPALIRVVCTSKASCVEHLPLGSHVRVLLSVEKTEILKVSKTELYDDDKSVYVVNADQSVEAVPIELGEKIDDKSFQIKSGLKPGMKIIAYASKHLKVGDKVGITVVDGKDVEEKDKDKEKTRRAKNTNEAVKKKS